MYRKSSWLTRPKDNWPKFGKTGMFQVEMCHCLIFYMKGMQCLCNAPYLDIPTYVGVLLIQIRLICVLTCFIVEVWV